MSFVETAFATVLTQQWNDDGRPAAAGRHVDWRHANSGTVGLLLPYNWHHSV
jgi:hypothetical protein